jgi:sugar-specific transcriptional regulator TrmB
VAFFHDKLKTASISINFTKSMELENLLQKIGLNSKEAKVYLASLQLGQDTVFNIAKKAEIKRSTCYVVMDSLIEKGFVSTLKTPKALLFIPQPPDKLLEVLNDKEESLKEALPELVSLFNVSPQKPKIQVFQGKSGIETVYREITKSLGGSEVLAFSDMLHFKDAYQDLLDKWYKLMKNKRFKSREIINHNSFSNAYIKRVRQNKNPNHQVRFFPKDKMILNNDNLIYENKLAIFSTKKELFVILIEHPAIVNTYRVLFDMAWKDAQKS